MLKRTLSILIISTLSLYQLSFAKGKSDTWDDVEIDSSEASALEIDITKKEEIHIPEKLKIFQEAYPDISFEPEWEDEVKDWKIKMTLGTKEIILYWANGAMLPEEELKNKDLYWSLLYEYDYRKPLKDPADFSKEEIEEIKKFGSDENRKSQAGTPMFFFDEIYDSKTRGKLESHIKGISFLGFRVNVHERIVQPLKEVETKINEAAKTNKEVADFVKSISKNEAYYWRVIANTNRKSFHSLGIAIDIRPKSYKWKEVYWSWTKDKDPDGWMLTPLKNRWMPPQAVIDIFEDQGFIWGGKWIIFDNMHFEYHPELIINARYEAESF
ncbi:MAG: M15 family metallopeptidase [Treponema sp.]|nr:M15 family metallopeptidase [Treponema sp.]